MAKISAALVKQLREMTDSPMMECKKALVEADGDIDKAVDVLRKMGLAKAVKRAGRETNEGTIGVWVSDDTKLGAMVELTCETDFVGTNAKFKAFALDLAKVVAENDPADLDAFKACPMGQGTVESELTEIIHVIGENMKINRFVRVTADNGALGTYTHHDGKHADIVTFSFSKPETASADAFKTYAHDVAMQVIASNPVSAVREDVPADVVEHEKGIYKAQAAESGKPEAIQEKIAMGKLEKFYKENVLTEQVFVKDSDKTIDSLTKEVSKEVGDDIKVVTFARFNFGE
ncbi:MAG: translation elongation factor Ts [Tractidigestivibacter sp.]|jgi:elongation factor Ts|uniref:translation elongation factor Ts n=1 Tax=Tractidigestivibacter sp. TaxID=2847320 RepID=UPI003D936F8C